MFTSRCTTPTACAPAHPNANMRKAIIGGAICRFSNTPFEISKDPDLMMHTSTPQFRSTPRAGFGLLGGSWDAPVGGRGGQLYIAGEDPRTQAQKHQRLDAVSNTGAGLDRGGCTP